MKENTLIDISEVCEELGITSRALRFYEEKGLISSTREFSNRRKYTREQIELVKKILVLRTLGLTVSQIQKIQNGDKELKQAIIEHKSKIIASIASKTRDIRLLDEALHTLDADGDIFENNVATEPICSNDTIEQIVNGFACGEYKSIFERFSDVLQAYTPLCVLERIAKDALMALGEFVSVDKITNDPADKNIFYGFLRYAKLGLRIKIVMHKDKILGFWLSYYEL